MPLYQIIWSRVLIPRKTNKFAQTGFSNRELSLRTKGKGPQEAKRRPSRPRASVNWSNWSAIKILEAKDKQTATD